MNTSELENKIIELDQKIKELEKNLNSNLYIRLLNPDYCPECHNFRKIVDVETPGYIGYQCQNPDCSQYLSIETVSAETLLLLSELSI